MFRSGVSGAPRMSSRRGEEMVGPMAGLSAEKKFEVTCWKRHKISNDVSH